MNDTAKHRSFRTDGRPRMEKTHMKTWRRSLFAGAGLFVALAAVVGLGILLQAQAEAAPAGAPPAEAAMAQGGTEATLLPLETCGVTAPGVRTCHVWAKTGTLLLPDGVTVPIWGFADSQNNAATLPGPTIIAHVGETLQVVLHNTLLTETISLDFPGQAGFTPDFDGIGAGNTITYSLALANPGTFAYEAGLTQHGPRQVAMGLFGALIVRPATPGQAYDDPTTAFDDEVLVVLSEIDPALNTDPYGFSLTQFAPRYWLINGLAYPQTAEIITMASNRVLLRYLNAGLEVQTMGLLGLRQQIIGSDGLQFTHPYTCVAEMLASGQTVDAIATIPNQAPVNTRYAFYNTSLLLHNAGDPFPAPGQVTYGGAMTFLRATSRIPPPPVGPIASLVQVSPSRIGTAGDVTLSATLTGFGRISVVAAEWFTDTLGPPGSGTAFAVTPGRVANVTAVIPEATLAQWPSGYPTFYVRGQDARGVWGPVGSVVLNLDKTGPRSVGLELVDNPTNGQVAITLLATGDDHSTGGGNVISGTYGIDAAPGFAMVLDRTDEPVVAMTAVIPTDLLAGLAEGPHQVLVSAQDDLLNWGVPGVITLSLDMSGPTAHNVTITPNPLNLSGAPPVTFMRVRAWITDTLAAGLQSPLVAAEAYINPDPANPPAFGSGIVMFATDGMYDSIGEAVYIDIPIASFLGLPAGQHVIAVRGLDVAGNWGEWGTTTLTIIR